MTVMKLVYPSSSHHQRGNIGNDSNEISSSAVSSQLEAIFPVQRLLYRQHFYKPVQYLLVSASSYDSILETPIGK